MERSSEIGAAHTAEQQLQRVRTQAAVFMIIASLAVGFIVGRASAWVVPFGSVAAVNSPPSKLAAVKPDDSTPKPASERPAVASSGDAPSPSVAADKPTAPVSDKQSSMGENTVPAPPEKPTPANEKPASAPESAAASTPPLLSNSPPHDPSASSSGTAPQRLTLINPGSAAPGPAPLPSAEPDQAATGADVDECERRYSSFRRSDGTYQPFGGGQRQRCPHLR